MAEKQLGFDSQAGAGGVAPCANNCGFFGTAATKRLCTQCYRDHLNDVANAAEVERMRALLASLASRELGKCQAAYAAPATEKPAASRCAACRNKVGLLGFACRCGGTFCSTHRHTEAHGCGFDYKKAGRERIAEPNLIVVAPKITKI